MVINTLLLLVTLVGIYFFIQRLRLQEKKDIVSEASYLDGAIRFRIEEDGKYSIWDKRVKLWSVARRGINNYHFKLYHEATNSEITLMKEDDPQFNTVKHRKPSGNENQWKILYSFQVSAGEYLLRYDSLDITEFPELGVFKNLGFFKIFKPIKADKYNVVVTRGIDESQQSTNLALIILSFMLWSSSLGFLIMRLIQK